MSDTTSLNPAQPPHCVHGPGVAASAHDVGALGCDVWDVRRTWRTPLWGSAWAIAVEASCWPVGASEFRRNGTEVRRLVLSRCSWRRWIDWGAKVAAAGDGGGGAAAVAEETENLNLKWVPLVDTPHCHIASHPSMHAISTPMHHVSVACMCMMWHLRLLLPTHAPCACAHVGHVCCATMHAVGLNHCGCVRAQKP